MSGGGRRPVRPPGPGAAAGFADVLLTLPMLALVALYRKKLLVEQPQNVRCRETGVGGGRSFQIAGGVPKRVVR